MNQDVPPKCDICGDEMCYCCVKCLDAEGTEIRRHAPGFHKKPTCAGMWIGYSNHGAFAIAVAEKDVGKSSHRSWKRFYGPIPTEDMEAVKE